MTQMRFGRYVPECGGYTDSLGTHHNCLLRVKGVQFCATCMLAQNEANKRKAIRADQRARRDRQQGRTYGPPPEGTDPFDGFRNS